MTQSFLQPKGSLNTNVDINGLQQQLAKMFANQQAQGQTEPSANPLRQTVNELIKSKLMNTIEVPQYTTLNDVLNAQKGDKLGVFADFLKNPNTMRTIGNILPKYGYNPQTGKLGNVMEENALREETEMQKAQAKALQEQKEQNDLATSMNSAFLQQDIADQNDKRMRELAKEEMEFKKQENELNRALQREHLNATIAHQRAMEGIARERLSATNKQEKQLQKNMETLNSLNAIQGQLDRFSDSFKDVRPTKLGALVAGAYAGQGFGNPAEANFNAQRTLLFNKIARELGGEKGVLSDQDIKRIESSLPSLSDSLTQKKAKMQAIYNLLDDRKQQYGASTLMMNQNNDPLGLGF